MKARTYTMRKCAYALAAAMLLSTTVPVMAEETGTEVETTIEVESEEESATGGAEGTNRASEIQNLISQLEKQIAELKAELQTLRADNVVKDGDIVYQDELESFEFSVVVVDSDTYDEINVSDPVTMYFGK